MRGGASFSALPRLFLALPLTHRGGASFSALPRHDCSGPRKALERHTKHQDLVLVLSPIHGANEQQRARDLVAKPAILDGGRRNLHRGEVGSPRPVEP